MVDYKLFSLINNLAFQNSILDKFFVFVSFSGIIILIVMILYLRNKNLIVKGFIVMAVVQVIDLIINLIYFRPRPFMEHEVNLLIEHDPDSSFPSGHAFRNFALAQLLYLHNKKFGIIALIIAFLVAFSRIFVGVHYPSDVLAGIIIGVGSAYLINYCYDRFIKNK